MTDPPPLLGPMPPEAERSLCAAFAAVLRRRTGHVWIVERHGSPPSLAGATVKELQALARERGIEGFSKLDKAALIERLRAERAKAKAAAPVLEPAARLIPHAEEEG